MKSKLLGVLSFYKTKAKNPRAQITPISDLYCIDAIYNFKQYPPSFFIEKAIEQIWFYYSFLLPPIHYIIRSVLALSAYIEYGQEVR